MSEERKKKTTKVYYYLDDNTPYLSVVPVAEDAITLGDFKKVFTRKGYKYFCKQIDPAIGCEVKVEIRDDSTRLQKSANGLVELVLLTTSINNRVDNGPGTITRVVDKKGRNTVVPPFALEVQDQKLRKRRSLHNIDSTDVPCSVTESTASRLMSNENSVTASSLSTIVSKRAGEVLAEMYTSNSEDPYRLDDSSSRFSMQSSSCLGLSAGAVKGTPNMKPHRQRRPRRERYRKAYIPSTISSITESSITSMSYPRIDVITLPMKNGAFLGISVVGHDGGIFVSDIVKDGAVALDGRIEVGDQIIQVNRTSFEDLTDDQAVKLLRQAAVSRRPVTLYVAKRPFNGDYQSDVFSGLASETLPIDVSLWVKTTQQTNVKPLKPFAIDDSSMMNGEVIMEEDNDTDVEGAYLERKNGFVGAVARINTAKSRIPEPALASTHIYSAEDVARRRENEENEQLVDTLNVNMDPTTILKYMARPDSGLQIKNRKWLKIPVPMSFIGREFVDWLMEHVHGISDRKEARIFAAKLLAEGHIRHVVNKLTFTEKCYYVFEDSILSVRNNNTTDSSSGKTGAEATTEVTYVGSPAPAIPVRPNKCNGNVRQPPATNVSTMIDQTWPLSPITVYGPPPRRSDCESPMTNDYASMIGPEVQSSAFMAMATEAPTLKLPHFPANPHTNAIRMRPDDDHQVPQPPNTPSAMSIIQRTAACEASETDFEVVDDDRRRIVREEK